MPPMPGSELTRWGKLKRIDFAGSLFLCLAIFSACFVLDTGGQKYPWNSATIIGMASLFAISVVFFTISTHFAAEPVFTLGLLSHYAVWTNYTINLLQVLVQFSLMLIVPIYFQVTAKATTVAAGAYLIPAFVGNTLGGLLSGYWIKHTGLYKPPTVAAPFLAILAVSLCYTMWNGHTTVWQALAILPGGMASGLVSSSAFVGLAAGIEEKDMAVAGSGMYLCSNLGAIAGASAGSAVYQISLKEGLEKALIGVENGAQVCCCSAPSLVCKANLCNCRSCSVRSRISRMSRMRESRFEVSLFRLLSTACIRSIVSRQLLEFEGGSR